MASTAALRPGPGSLPARGLALMVGGVAILTFMDATMKALTAHYPVSEAIFFRSVLALPLLLVFLRWDGGVRGFLTARPGPQLLRGFLSFLTGFAFFHALARMPMTDALAIGFSAPFIVAALSGPVLGEAVGRRQWVAIGGGFLGVLVILRPGFGMVDVGALFALAAAVTYALNGLALRKLGRTDAASVTTIWGTVVPAILNGLIALPAWKAPVLEHLPLLAAAGILGAVGSMMMSAAFRLAPAATLAPLDYTAMAWAVVLGFLVFGDLPGPAVILGASIIIGSGLLLARAPRG